MDFFTAKRFARQGYAIRRAGWVEDVETPIQGSTNKRVTAWISYAVGLWYYRPTDGTPARVVRSTDFGRVDMLALDWTLADAEQNPQMPPTSLPDGGSDPALPPLPPVLPPGSNTSGGMRDNGTVSGDGNGLGSGDGDGDGGENGGGGGGGGGAGAPGGNNPGKPGHKNKPDRSAPSVTLSGLTRTSGEACVPLLGTGAEDTTPVTDSFVCNIALGADGGAKPGEVWFYSLLAKGQTRKTGTIAPGATVGVTFSVTGAPGASFPVQANVNLANVGLSNSDSKTASLRGACGLAPVLTAFRIGDIIAQNFEKSGSEGVTEWQVLPVFSASPAGLTYEWTVDDVDGGDLPWQDFGNDGSAYFHAFSLTITNDYGSATLSGSINVLGT